MMNITVSIVQDKFSSYGSHPISWEYSASKSQYSVEELHIEKRDGEDADEQHSRKIMHNLWSACIEEYNDLVQQVALLQLTVVDNNGRDYNGTIEAMNAQISNLLEEIQQFEKGFNEC